MILVGEIRVPTYRGPVFSGTPEFVLSEVIFAEVLQAELTSLHPLLSMFRANVPLESLISREFGITMQTCVLTRGACGFVRVFGDDMAFERRRIGEALVAVLALLHGCISVAGRSHVVNKG